MQIRRTLHLNYITDATTEAKEVTLIPRLGFYAKSQNLGLAWLTWSIARSFDPAGSGIVNKVQIQQGAVAMRFSKRQWQRGIKQALQAGFLTRVDRNRSGTRETHFKYTSIAGVAKLVRCDQLGSKKAVVRADLLAGNSCWAYVWATYLSTLYDCPISRSEMTRQTLVSARTQQRYEAQVAGIQAIETYIVTDIPADHLDGWRDFCNDHPGVFVGTNHATDQRVLFRRGPNQRVVDVSGVRTTCRGSLKRINRVLAGTSISATVGRDRDGNSHIRMYHHAHKTLKTAISKWRRFSAKGIPFDHPDNLLFERPGCKDRRTRRIALYDVVRA